MLHSFSRSLNILKAGFSYSASLITGRLTGRWMPVTAGIEITNQCNLRCPECLSGSGQMTRPAGFIKRALFDRIIGELTPYLLNINLYFQGEPMMHPDFFHFIENSAGINVIVSTNGHFITGENAEKIAASSLSKLIVSLDGMKQDTYALYRRNGDYETVLKGIKSVSEAIKKSGSRVKLEIQFLVNRHNEKEIPEAVSFAEKVNAPLKLKSMQLVSKNSKEEWLPSDKRFRRYELSRGVFRIKNSLPDRCFRLWISPVITWDGKVVPCCFDKDADHVMGDLNESSFRNIWYGEKYMEFRKSILKGRSRIEICRNCTSGMRGVKI